MCVCVCVCVCVCEGGREGRGEREIRECLNTRDAALVKGHSRLADGDKVEHKQAQGDHNSDASHNPTHDHQLSVEVLVDRPSPIPRRHPVWC